MNIEKVSTENELQEILKSYDHLFEDLNDQQDLDKSFYDLRYENFLNIDTGNLNKKSSESENLFNNDKDDASQITENLSRNFQSNDELIEELIDCIRKINENKEKVLKKNNDY